MSHDVPAGALNQVKCTFPPGKERQTNLLLISELEYGASWLFHRVPKRICEMFIY